MITTTSPAVSAGDTVAQASVSEPGFRTAVVSVKRTTLIKQICCQRHTSSNWKNDKKSVCTNVNESVARLIDPLDFTHIQELPELVTFFLHGSSRTKLLVFTTLSPNTLWIIPTYSGRKSANYQIRRISKRF